MAIIRKRISDVEELPWQTDWNLNAEVKCFAGMIKRGFLTMEEAELAVLMSTSQLVELLSDYPEKSRSIHKMHSMRSKIWLKVEHEVLGRLR